MDLKYEPSTTGVFHYYLPPLDGSRPYKNINDRNDKNYIRDTHEVVVENIRGNESEFTLNVSGFQYYTHNSRCKSFNTDAEVRENYYPESIDVIKRLTGASKVILFDHRFIDTRTMNNSDLMPMTYGVKYNPAHKWIYLGGMATDEIVLFKCYDTLQDNNICTFNAHSAFVDPSAPRDSPLRESIELRALVFYV
ncbi:hypothetical protein C0989_003949 [Termitomyces sp. Mn162]|nr:hypothetical protein C0989_003949 [Termitomyces sp. Mn162]